MIDYLLGNLTEEEQVRVEDRAFSDAGYRNALEAVETDLIDAYVRGQLTSGERRGFERRFLTSPGRRSRVEFGKALAGVASELRPEGHPNAWQSLLNLVRGGTIAVRFMTALATVIFLAVGSWLVVQNASLRSRVAALDAERHELEAREQARRRELSAQSQKQPASVPSASTPIVASLIFVPGLTRGETRVEQLVLDPGAQIAHFDIQLEDRDDYPRFRAELLTRGEEILARTGLSRRRTTAGYRVSFDVPASALTAGQYELALKGIAPNQSVEDVAFYYFRVEKR